MSGLDHQELAKLLNRRAENKRMEELEERSVWIFWLLIVIAAITLWSVT